MEGRVGMAINSVDSVTISSAGRLQQAQTAGQRPEPPGNVQNAAGPATDAFQVDLSAEARAAQAASETQNEQAVQEAQSEAARQEANPAATYNSAGEMTG